MGENVLNGILPELLTRAEVPDSRWALRSPVELKKKIK